MSILVESLPSIVTVTDPQMIEEIARFRARVWAAKGANLPVGKPWLDEHDSHATHICMFHEGQLIGAGRLCFHGQLTEAPDAHTLLINPFIKITGKIACLSRRVVDPGFQGHGFGKQLLRHRIALAKAQGANFCFTRVALHLMPAMENLGFSIYGVAKTDARLPNTTRAFIYAKL